MKELFSPPVFPGTVTEQVDTAIKDIFRAHSSNNCALIDTVWAFRTNPDIIEFANKNQDKHLLLLSATDPFAFQPRHTATGLPNNAEQCYRVLSEHPAGYSTIGNVFTKNYFSYWLEFFRIHNNGGFDFDYNSVNIDKLYMCLNRKPHWHRIQLVKKLYDHNLQYDGLISLGISDGNPDLDFFGLPVPIRLDTDIVDEEGNKAASRQSSGITCNITSLGHTGNWSRFFLNVVTETAPGYTDFISEKTLKPIMGYKPFVFIGCSMQYEILHSWGIDTFDDVFGLDYTEEDYKSTDILARMDQVVQLLQDLKKENLNQLYKSLLPRLIKNRQRLLEAMETNHKYIVEVAKQF